MNPCQCRPLVVGSAKDLKAFCDREEWPAVFTKVELLELPSTRRSWQFAAPNPPLTFLRRLASRWPLLNLLVACDTGQVKGVDFISRISQAYWCHGGSPVRHQVLRLVGTRRMRSGIVTLKLHWQEVRRATAGEFNKMNGDRPS